MLLPSENYTIAPTPLARGHTLSWHRRRPINGRGFYGNGSMFARVARVARELFAKGQKPHMGPRQGKIPRQVFPLGCESPIASARSLTDFMALGRAGPNGNINAGCRPVSDRGQPATDARKAALNFVLLLIFSTFTGVACLLAAFLRLAVACALHPDGVAVRPSVLPCDTGHPIPQCSQ